MYVEVGHHFHLDSSVRSVGADDMNAPGYA